MPGTAAGLRTDTTARLEQLERQRPEWRAWLMLLAETERAAGDPGWMASLVGHDADAASSGDVPLLHGRTLVVDTGKVQQLITRLARIAAEAEPATALGSYRPPADEAMQLLAAALRHDAGEIASIAAERGVDAGALESVAHFAVLPVLRPWSRAHADLLPPHWTHGYCPVCAAWPTYAERRGLDRSRRLRCGRCASEWEVEWLYCIYCDERDHNRLGTLEPEGRGELLKVETCATCNGYLKSLASLQGFSDFELLVQDLETVELDLVALERGYRRPSQSGFALDTHVIDHASRRRL